jgi:ABC-type lipoprotein export system ATPase subunit
VYQGGGQRVLALRGLDLDVSAGERVAIMGRSGSGKTTLLNILAGLETPTRGRVAIAGRDLAGMATRDREEFRRHVVGYVWQQPEVGLLPGLTALQNVLVPMLGEAVSRSERVEAAVKLLHDMKLDSRLHDRLPELPPAETERLAIAVALANRPAVLLADELTAGLEWPTARDLLTDLQELLDETGTAAVIVTHDPRVQRYVGRGVHIRDGVALAEVDGAEAGRGRRTTAR